MRYTAIATSHNGASRLAASPRTVSETPSAFMVIAHRGASAYAPENTYAAFDLALRMGIRQIELDVQETRDGEIIVMHDLNVDRTSDGNGRVADYTLDELLQLDAGSWFGPLFGNEKIPRYEHVLIRYKGQLHLHTELKGTSPRLAAKVAHLVCKHGMSENVTITSAQSIRLQELRAQAPALTTGWLVEEISGAVIKTAHRLGCQQLCPRADTLNPAVVQQAHNAGLSVRAWGVTDEILMQDVVASGADGMTVNWPDKLIAYLTRNGRVWN